MLRQQAAQLDEARAVGGVALRDERPVEAAERRGVRGEDGLVDGVEQPQSVRHVGAAAAAAAVVGGGVQLR